MDIRLTGLNFNNNDDEDRLPDTLPGDETQSQPLSSSPLNKNIKAHGGNKDLLDVIREGTYDFTPDRFKNVSEAAKRLIDKMLIVNPKDRYSAPHVLASSWLDDKELMITVSKTLKPYIISEIKSLSFDRGIGSK
ncbi:hypothetical protein HCN44_001807 [Aphidius gifuensis]|uniref:Uncharacterized protein n=1 Tax=Aphidius gifuensis TaxID=684658 RepID=A0A834XWK7_APHGI|nr:hypothetical protein HCN44_001807 [Aphidius gifuensis]